MNDGGGSSVLGTALKLVGATAGLAALITFVGGAMLWVRFDELGLPADQVVALLPERILLTVGAHAIIGPLIAGAVVFFLLMLAGSLPGWARIALLVVLAAVAVFVVYELVRDFDDFPERAVMAAATALALLAIGATLAGGGPPSRLAWVVFASFAIAGGVLAVVRTSGAPKMEPAAVLLKEGRGGVSGFFVGETGDRLFVAVLPGGGDPGDPFADADVDRIVEIPRDDVARLALRRPVGIRPHESGREEARSLLTDLVAEQAKDAPAPEEPVTTLNPVTAFAPLVHLHAEEPWLPMSVEAFLDSSWIIWAHSGRCPDYSPALNRHLRDPAARRAEIMGVDRVRLGRERLYEHTARCDDTGRTFNAKHHTRPFDGEERPRGLPLNEGFYLDLWDRRRRGSATVESEGARKVVDGAPVYFEIQEEAGSPELRITYWLFYGFSQPPGSRFAKLVGHEGDWERVSVRLRRGPGKNDYLPLSVRYYQHEVNRDVPWSAVLRVASGDPRVATHPVVYSARGSHASYPRAGRYEQVFAPGGRRRFAVHDVAFACPACPEWRSWQQLSDARAQSWYGFGGAWGKSGGSKATAGPLGPSSYKLDGLGTPPAPVETREAPATGAPALQAE